MTSYDLLIVGAGRLGARIAALHRSGTVFEETSKHHAGEVTARSVVFALPPSALEKDPGALERALERWSGTGVFLLVSSTGVYAEEQGGVVTETSALGTGERAK